MQVPVDLWPALFRAAGGNEWPPRSAEDADAFLTRAASESLLPLVFDDDSLPVVIQEARKRFSVFWRAQIQRTELLIRALQRIADILHGEEFVLLKGAAHAFRLYPQPYFRPMGDLDILVQLSRMELVCQRFLEAGMLQHFPAGASSHLQSHHEAVFTIDGVTVEPHQAFVQRARHRIDYDGIWSRRVPFDPAGIHAFRLGDTDAILYQALRLAMDEFNAPLIHYVDFYLLLERFDGDLAIVAERAREWRTERALYGGLRQLTRLFPELQTRIGVMLDQLLTPAVRRHLDEHVLPSRLGRHRISRREQLWRKFNLMDGYRERLRFLLYFGYAGVAGRLIAARHHIDETKP